MTVWAVNLNKDDTSAALQYGDIRHINMRYVYGDEIVDEHVPKQVMTEIQFAAAEFDPAYDYVLIIGDHLQLVAFVAEIGRQKGRDVPIHVLRYDKKAQGYIPVWV